MRLTKKELKMLQECVADRLQYEQNDELRRLSARINHEIWLCRQDDMPPLTLADLQNGDKFTFLWSKSVYTFVKFDENVAVVLTDCNQIAKYPTFLNVELI